MTAPALSGSALADGAARYHAAGLCVIPLKPRDKRPDVPWLEYTTRISSMAECTSWWRERPDRNVGIVCGPVSQNLVTLDFDAEAAFAAFVAKFPEYCSTRIHLSGSQRGYHVFFFVGTVPASHVYTAAFGRVEVKAAGTQVVFPPSVHPSGNRYGVYHKDRVMRVPHLEAVVAWLEDAKRALDHTTFTQELVRVQRSNPATPSTAYAKGALRSEAIRLQAAPPGGRNNELNKSALKLGHFVAAGVLSEQEVSDALLDAARANGLVAEGEHGVWATIQSGLHAGMRQPANAPASVGLRRLDNQTGRR